MSYSPDKESITAFLPKGSRALLKAKKKKSGHKTLNAYYVSVLVPELDGKVKRPRGHNIADMEDFKDVVHHSTTTKFNWPDRLRLLVGRPVTIRSKIYTAEPVTVLRSEAEATVHRIRKPRIRSGEIVDEAFTHGG